MSFLVRCPYCPAEITLPETAVRASCPHCLRSFDTVPPTGSSSLFSATPSVTHSARHTQGRSRSSNEQDAPAGTVNLWGLAALFLGVLALLQASLLGERWLTIALAGLGVGVVFLGALVGWFQEQPSSRVWLGVGGALSGVVLLLALFFPGMLNNFWALDIPVARGDPNKLERVPHRYFRAPGKPLADDDWIDAASEGIRQGDVAFRIQSVQTSPAPELGSASCLLVHLRLANVSGWGTVRYEGFPVGQHQPVLTDEAGHSYRFLGQRARLLGLGALTFGAGETPTIEIPTSSYVDRQLAFELPPAGLDSLKLQLPASAWGRKGMCHLRIPRSFQATVPELPTKETKP
jgi:hypothetical protein